MRTRNSLAAVVNRISDDDLVSISRDDALVLFEGLSEHAGAPDVDAALARLAAYIWGETSSLHPGKFRRVLH